MVILVDKFKFPFGFENHQKNSKALSSSLKDFRSKISNFLNQILLNPKPGSKTLSLTWFQKCFDLIQVTNNSFAEMAVEIDYPMSKWGGKTIEQYLSYSLNLMDLLNAINSSVSHLNQVKISNFYALSLVHTSPTSAAKHLKKIPPRGVNLGKDFRVERLLNGIEESSDSKEVTVLEGLIVVKRIGFLALGLVLSGLCSDAKPYNEIRKIVEGFEDSLTKSLDSILSKDILDGVMAEVKEVNSAEDRFSAVISSSGRWSEAAMEFKKWLEILENSIQAIEKQSNNLFSEVLTTRNELLDNFRHRNHRA